MTSFGFNETFYAKVSFIKHNIFSSNSRKESKYLKLSNYSFKERQDNDNKNNQFSSTAVMKFGDYGTTTGTGFVYRDQLVFFNSNTQILIQHSQFLHLPIQLFLNLIRMSPQASHYSLTCFHLPQWYLNPLSRNDIMSTAPDHLTSA